MVGEENDEALFQEASPVKRFEIAADLLIDEADGPVVALPGMPRGIGAEIAVP